MIPYYLLSAALPIIIMLPLSIKWEIQRTYAIPWLLLMSAFSCLMTWMTRAAFPGWSDLIGTLAGLVTAVSLTVLVLLMRFYRDPERNISDGEGLLVSPADGTVIYVKSIENGEFPLAVKKGRVISLDEFIRENSFMKKGVQIGIAMNFLNVHVNRVPLSGTITTIRRIPGSFHSLKNISSLLENERVCTLIEGKGITVGVVQIASRLVRRITAYFNEGDSCRIGDRMGMIRFGSQVDLLIPETADLQVLVNVGDAIHAGETVVAKYSIAE